MVVMEAVLPGCAGRCQFMVVVRADRGLTTTMI
jgi:hypothetical protein